MVRIAVAVAGMAALVACSPGGPAAAGRDLSAEERALAALLAAYDAGDCAAVVRDAPGFHASTDLRLDAASYVYGRCFYLQGDLPAAEAVLGPVAERRPPDLYTAPAAYFHARTAYLGGRFGDAEARFDAFLARFPHSSYRDNALYYGAKSAYRAGAFTRAADRFAPLPDRADIAPEYRAGAAWYAGECWLGLALAAPEAGDAPAFETAAGWYRRVQTGFADSTFADDAAWSLARLDAQRGRPAGSVEPLRAFLRDHPGSTRANDAHYDLGRALEDSGALAEALEVFEQHGVLYPASVYVDNARYHAGLVLWAQAQAAETAAPADAPALYARARSAFESFLADFPASSLRSYATYWLGRVRYAQKDWAPAFDAFVAGTDDPSSLYVDNSLYYAGMCRYHQGLEGAGAQAYEDAVAWFDRLLAEHGGSSYADGGTYFRARCLFQTARWKDAAAAFEAFLAAFPVTPYRDEAWYHLAWAEALAGDCAAAADALGRMGADVPGSPWLDRAETRVADTGC